MSFFQKIYYNDKPLILTSDREATVANNLGSQNYKVLYGATVQNIYEAVNSLNKYSVGGVIIVDGTEGVFQQCLHGVYHSIDAAGGVVFNENGSILMIYRKGKWDLPKGKCDPLELIEDCAIREVMEETGLKNVSISSKICESYHIYTQDSQNILKKTVWYQMASSVSEKLKPQEEENILEARWVACSDIPAFSAMTFESIKEVLRHCGIKW